MYVLLCVAHVRVPMEAGRGHLNPVEQEFQVVVSYPTMLGIELPSFGSSACALDC